ncbi:MAG: 30S ribosome-binding factor RbfA [Chloroflexi bacterium]|nr:30S ribosome-binding factor RbfA [Chloroflexota bacterium]
MQDRAKSRRAERVNVLLRQQLSEIIAREMKDPRLTPIITLVRVEVSRDLKYAKVFTSVLGTPQESKAAVEALNAASGFLRRELTPRLSIKTVPFLTFVPDDSIEKGTQLLKKITEVRAQDSSQETSTNG